VYTFQILHKKLFVGLIIFLFPPRKTARRRVNFYGTLSYTVHFRAISAGLWITDRNIIRETISELRARFADAYSRFETIPAWSVIFSLSGERL